MKIRFTITVVLFVLLYNSTSAQESINKVRFINAFTRYMEWPLTPKDQFFNIGVYGSFDLYKLVSEETMGRSVNGKNVVPVNLFNESQLDLTKLHILLVGKKYCTEDFLKRLSDKFEGKPTLIVAEENGVTYGANIGFTENGSSVGFSYNMESIRSRGILISKQLAAMGQEIIN